mgnify:CR=1 FL=1
MWKYVKTLQYPINIKKKDLKMRFMDLGCGPENAAFLPTRYINEINK